MSTFDLVPMLRAPQGWPGTLVATLAMLVLAGLDLLVAFAAREWVEYRCRPASPRRRAPASVVGGLGRPTPSAPGANVDEEVLA